jgi:F-type H+-transporting ATPase subunit a
MRPREKLGHTGLHALNDQELLALVLGHGVRGRSALTLAGGIAITLFEVFVAGLQAYIFALLATVYINMSIEEEH